MSTDNLDLDALRGLLDAATPGPWVAQDFDDYPGDEGTAILGGGPEVMDRHLIAYALTLGDGPGMKNPERCDADAALIVALVNAAPALIAAARERDAVVEAVRGVHARVKFTEPSGTYLICATCTGSHEFGQEYYPCPTIRALDAATRDGGAE